MSAWRRAAIEKLPRFRTLIEQSESPGALWIDLFREFERAHRDPADVTTITQIYEFAWWGAAHEDVETRAATICGFFEELPSDSNIRRLMPQFISSEAFLGMTDVFKYHLESEQHDEFVRSFLEGHKWLEQTAKQ
jgi:hypothetical protein